MNVGQLLNYINKELQAGKLKRSSQVTVSLPTQFGKQHDKDTIIELESWSLPARALISEYDEPEPYVDLELTPASARRARKVLQDGIGVNLPLLK